MSEPSQGDPSDLSQGVSFKPFEYTLRVDTMVLSRKLQPLERVTRAMLHILLLLCVGLIALMGYALATKGITLGGVAFAAATTGVLLLLAKFLNEFLRKDGVLLIEASPSGVLLRGNASFGRRYTTRYALDKILAVTVQQRSAKAKNTPRQWWFEVSLGVKTQGDAERIPLGHWHAANEQDRSAENGAFALAEHLGVLAAS